MLSEHELEEIRRKLKNASMGPWKKGKIANSLVSTKVPRHFEADDQARRRHIEHFGGYVIAENLAAEDQEFILAARAMIPQLLKRLEELEERLKLMQPLMDAAKKIMTLLNDDRVKIRVDFLPEYSSAYGKLMEELSLCEKIQDQD